MCDMISPDLRVCVVRAVRIGARAWTRLSGPEPASGFTGLEYTEVFCEWLRAIKFTVCAALCLALSRSSGLAVSVSVVSFRSVVSLHRLVPVVKSLSVSLCV